ncbi:hypothetical protein BCR42DRAFT_403498 [Absidia repens]|uniref:SH3 domain-containing protein n=1 Tax=Absidia repens TaxID=90262 RepID=A0A1X2IZJ0_9FUNG|nr:hypothetical protein BCR42DRAFT_403498 [Absidia repens]
MMEYTTGYHHHHRRQHHRLSPSFDSSTNIRSQQMLSTLIHPYTLCDPITETMEETDSIKFELDQEESSDDASCLSSITTFDEETTNDHTVYALHVFIATVEGQISVMRGDKLILLDDTNAYWWLVKIMKTSDIGYIPAENVETPFERLARFNKIRNSEIILLPTSDIKGKHLKSSCYKKVSMAKSVTVQSLIIITDDDSDSHIMKTYEETQVATEKLNSPDEEQENDNCLPTRLSNHALSVGLTQHFIRYQSSRPQSSIADTNSMSNPNITTTTATTKRPVRNLSQILSGSNKNHVPTDEPLSFTSSDSNAGLPHQPNDHLSVLRVFPGNINVKATFNSVLVNENTTAEQLLNFALKRFRLLDSHERPCEGIEYYISVKVSDNDEITLSPHDKPLAMFYSLNTLLTTPMPSLTHIRSKVKLTRIGVTHAAPSNGNATSFGENSVIRFLLNKRIKRINELDGQLRIKIAYYTDASSTSTTSTRSSTGSTSNTRTSRLSQLYRRSNSHQRRLGRLSSSGAFSLSSSPAPDQLLDRIEKLVSVPGYLVVSDLTSLALEKFHIQQGVPYTFTNDKLDKYGMTLVLQGKEHVLNASRCIMDILNDEWLNPKGKDDDGILFVLRKMQSRVRSPPPSPLYEDPTTTTLPIAAAVTNSPSPPPPPPPRSSIDTMTTNHDLCNSSLSLASSSSSSASSSSSPPSLITPDSTTNATGNNNNNNNNKSSPLQQHAKLSTDILLHRIDMTLSSLEKNLLVNPGPTFKTSSRNSLSYAYR